MRELPSIIAEEIAHATGASFLLRGHSPLSRRRPRVTSVDVSRRPALLEGVFSTDLTFDKGTRLLLVDDVVQSQATLGEAARVLLEAGAAHVTAVAAAHAVWGANTDWASSSAA